MHHLSYKYYLDLLDTKPRFSILEKATLSIIGFFLISIGFLSALFYYQYQKEIPIRTQAVYLEVATSGYNAAKGSQEELLSSFKVAGTKTQFDKTAKDATASSSLYSSSLDDVNRLLAKTTSTRQTILSQKKQLERVVKPAIFANLNKQLIDYYQKSAGVLDRIEKEEKFAKDMLIALGPDFYLPRLTDESLWQTGKNKEIIAYYDNLKNSANASLTAISYLTPPVDFKAYVADQVAYFELLTKTADSVTNILKEQEKPKEENSQIEKAYQVLNLAKGNNEKLSTKLLASRSQLLDVKRNLESFAQVRLAQNSLEEKLTDAAAAQPQPKSFPFSKFLGGLQIL